MRPAGTLRLRTGEDRAGGPPAVLAALWAALWAALAGALWMGAAVLSPGEAAAQEYRPYRALVGVRSNFSTGKEPVEAIAQKAEALGLSAVLLADHHRLALSWGLPPFRNLLRKKQEFPSVRLSGISSYLRAVLAADERHRRVLLLPGLTATPFYYWTGSPFRGDLTAHQWHNRLLVFGMNNHLQTLENLPEVGGSFSRTYFRQLLPGTAFFLVTALIGLILFFGSPRWRAAGFLLFLAGGLSSLNYHPFASSPFDAYHGDQGALPYQLLTDYAGRRGGIVLWTGVRGNPRAERAGAARLLSRPRPDLLAAVRGATAFDAFMEGDPPALGPGGLWDKILLEFTSGKRAAPVWVFGGAGERRLTPEGAEELSAEVQTVFYLKERTQAALLEALRRGRMYVLREGPGFRLELDRFTLKPQGLSASALPGEQLDSPGPVEVSLRVSSSDGGRRVVSVHLIRDGRVVKTWRGETPLEQSFLDSFIPSGKTSFYRLEVSGPSGARLLTNPAFVRFLGPAAPGPSPRRGAEPS
ncbi:MAG: hypothetical protein HYY21_01325 [Candidatus Tectomicrobia bacterium]|nr:hypothetical protein [Candidatus Tectomicrobia bacterium]